VCRSTIAYHFVIYGLLAFVLAAHGLKGELHEFHLDEFDTDLVGMLGLGTMSTVDKVKKKKPG
jgi:hypothetical protein